MSATNWGWISRCATDWLKVGLSGVYHKFHLNFKVCHLLTGQMWVWVVSTVNWAWVSRCAIDGQIRVDVLEQSPPRTCVEIPEEVLSRRLEHDVSKHKRGRESDATSWSSGVCGNTAQRQWNVQQAVQSASVFSFFLPRRDRELVKVDPNT